MELINCMVVRRSIRSYLDKEVEPQKLNLILKSAQIAPTARNRQAFKVIVVDNSKVREEMLDACNGQKMMESAPLSLVVVEDNHYVMACGQNGGTVDGSIAMSFMMLQAAELGLGTCWLGNFDAQKTAKLLGLPEGAVPVVITPLGYPAEDPAARPRKELEDIVRYDKY